MPLTAAERDLGLTDDLEGIARRALRLGNDRNVVRITHELARITTLLAEHHSNHIQRGDVNLWLSQHAIIRYANLRLYVVMNREADLYALQSAVEQLANVPTETRV